MFKIPNLYDETHTYVRGYTAKQYKQLCSNHIDGTDTLLYSLREDLRERFRRTDFDIYEILFFSAFLVAVSVNSADLETGGNHYPVFSFLNDFRNAARERIGHMKKRYSGYSGVAFDFRSPTFEDVVDNYKNYIPISKITNGKMGTSIDTKETYERVLSFVPASVGLTDISFTETFSLNLASGVQISGDREGLFGLAALFFPKEWVIYYHREMGYLVAGMGYSNEYLDNLLPMEYGLLESLIKEKEKQNEQQSE